MVINKLNGKGRKRKGTGNDENLKRYFKKIECKSYSSKKFCTTRFRSVFMLENVALHSDPEFLLKKLFEKSINKAIWTAKNSGLNPDRLGMIISSTELKSDIIIHIQKINDDMASSVFHRFEIIAQSYDLAALLGSPIMVNITTLDRKALKESGNHYKNNKLNKNKIIGRGIKGRKLQTAKNDNKFRLINSNSLLKIGNTDTLCLFYAIELTRLYSSHTLSSQRISDMTIEFMREKYIYPLLKAINTPNFLIEYDFENYAQMVQIYYNKIYPGQYKIFVFNGPKAHISETQIENYKIPICIHYDAKKCHFDGIRSLKLYFGGKYYCFICMTTYDRALRHSFKCKSRCKNCCRVGPEFPCLKEEFFRRKCSGCNKYFDNELCYNYHLKNDRKNYDSVCNLSKKCEKCSMIYNVRDYKEKNIIHSCSENFCHFCSTFRPVGHECFIRKPLINKKKKIYRIISLDFECTQNTKIEENSSHFEHFPNHICARIFCPICIEKDIWQEEITEEKNCKICAPYRTVVFSCINFEKTEIGLKKQCKTPLNDFLDWLFNLNAKYKSIVFTHYGGRYDLCFIFTAIFNNYRLKPEMIKNGNRLIELTINRQGKIPETRFRDSWNLISIPLEKFAKTFGLGEEMEKEFFPHLFNKPENYEKILNCLPPKEDYICSTYSSEKYKRFNIFYEANKNCEFNLREALASYCLSDVNTLAAGLIAMQKLFFNVTNLDIFESITLAGAVMRHFRVNHMPEDYLAICPETGWDPNFNQSHIALSYLKWFGWKNNLKIQTAESAEGEYKIPGTNYRVDGFIRGDESRNGLIVEIYGDIWHGCPRHFDEGSAILPTGLTVEMQQQKDAEREEIIRNSGYDLVIKWECEIREELKNNEEMRKFFEEECCFDSGPIRLRKEGFFGGRTGPLKMYQPIKAGHKIAVVDFCSLYPSVNYFGSYPIKHPQWKVYNKYVNWTSETENHVKGFLKCRVLAPKNLKIPVLPVKFDDGRLLFPLCRLCSLRYKKGGRLRKYHCDHNESERSFVVTQTHYEINAALRAGYRILDLYRTLEFEEFDDNLFKSYVREFLKLKIEASGWPTDDLEERKNFLEEYKKYYDIDLVPERIEENSGLRFLAKQSLNSLWGRFALRQRMSKCRVVNDPIELEEMLNDHRIEVTQIDHMNEEELLITFISREEFCVESSSSNIIIACFTTSMARLKLLEAMQKVTSHPNSILLYTDTDSLIYFYAEGDNPLKTGKHLGELVEEYADMNILEFISGGSKAYALKLVPKNNPQAVPQYIIKIRGITLDTATSEVFHYEKFKEKVLAYGDPTDEEILLEYPHKLMVKKTRGVQTWGDFKKRYECVVQKGITIDHSLEIVPFGFCDNIYCDCIKN